MRLLVVLAALTCATVANAQTLLVSETQLTTASGDQFDPAIDSNLVVYTDFDGMDADVWYTDVATGQHFQVTFDSGDQQLTGISDGRIVYNDLNPRDVYVYDIATGTSTNVTADIAAAAFDPAIGGNLMAWSDSRTGNVETFGRDVVTGEQRQLSNDASLIDEAVSISDGTIVWEACGTYVCDIYAYDWPTATLRQLTNTAYASERLPDIDGRIVVYQREQGTPVEKDIVALDLDTGVETVLTMPGDQETPHISGHFVAFNDFASGQVHIGLWDLSTGYAYQVTTDAGGQYLNDIDGNRIVYADGRGADIDIWMTTFTVEQPTPVDCSSLEGATPLFDQTFVRPKGKPVVFEAAFAGVPGTGLMCIDNPASGDTRVHGGSVALNQEVLVGSKDFQFNLIERTVALASDNTLRVALSARPNTGIRVRVYSAPDAGALSAAALGHGKGKAKKVLVSAAFQSTAGAGGASGVGCSQSGGELVPWALALLAVFALLPRPARAMARRR